MFVVNKISVNFSSLRGSKFTAQLRIPFTFNDISNILKEKLGSDNYRLVINGKELTTDTFETEKTNIVHNSTIYVCVRLLGGSNDMIDLEMHREVILSNIMSELEKTPAESIPRECMICTNKVSCIKYCCKTYLCKPCTSTQFFWCALQLKCLDCGTVVPYSEIFKNPTFLDSLDNYNGALLRLKSNVDFHICDCGAYGINGTMYSQQQCQNCKRWMCAFCNKDWNEQMTNNMYTCGVNCVWETKISYQLVPFYYDKSMKVRTIIVPCINHTENYIFMHRFQTVDAVHVV